MVFFKLGEGNRAAGLGFVRVENCFGFFGGRFYLGGGGDARGLKGFGGLKLFSDEWDCFGVLNLFPPFSPGGGLMEEHTKHAYICSQRIDVSKLT